MAGNRGQQEAEYHRLAGAYDATRSLRELLELRLGEARDDNVREVLDNIIEVVKSREVEYGRRRDELQSEVGDG